MSNDTIAKIFDPFFTTKSHGTGLGLSVVYRLLESYNGRMDVQSQQDQGSTFTAYLKRIDLPGLLP
jgi:signal transduction histidine kinase